MEKSLKSFCGVCYALICGWTIVGDIYHICGTSFVFANTSVHNLGFSSIYHISLDVCSMMHGLKADRIVCLFLITGFKFLVFSAGVWERFNYQGDRTQKVHVNLNKGTELKVVLSTATPHHNTATKIVRQHPFTSHYTPVIKGLTKAVRLPTLSTLLGFCFEHNLVNNCWI